MTTVTQNNCDPYSDAPNGIGFIIDQTKVSIGPTFIGKDFIIYSPLNPTDPNMIKPVIMNIKTKKKVTNLETFLDAKLVPKTNFLNFHNKNYAHRDAIDFIIPIASYANSIFKQTVYFRQIQDDIIMLIMNVEGNHSLYKFMMNNDKFNLKKSVKFSSASTSDDMSEMEIKYRSLSLGDREFGIIEYYHTDPTKEKIIVLDYENIESHYYGGGIVPSNYSCPQHKYIYCYIYHTQCLLVHCHIDPTRYIIHNLVTKEAHVISFRSKDGNTMCDINYDKDNKRFVITDGSHYIILHEFTKKCTESPLKLHDDKDGGCGDEQLSSKEPVFLMYTKKDKNIIEVIFEHSANSFIGPLEIKRTSTIDPFITNEKMLYSIVFDAVFKVNDKTDVTYKIDGDDLHLRISLDMIYRTCVIDLLLKKKDGDPVVRLKKKLEKVKTECQELRKRVSQLESEKNSDW